MFKQIIPYIYNNIQCNSTTSILLVFFIYYYLLLIEGAVSLIYLWKRDKTAKQTNNKATQKQRNERQPFRPLTGIHKLFPKAINNIST